MAHPGVAEVAVWKRPDPEWGERVVAWVVPVEGGPSLDELRQMVTEAWRRGPPPRSSSSSTTSRARRRARSDDGPSSRPAPRRRPGRRSCLRPVLRRSRPAGGR